MKNAENVLMSNHKQVITYWVTPTTRRQRRWSHIRRQCLLLVWWWTKGRQILWTREASPGHSPCKKGSKCSDVIVVMVTAHSWTSVAGKDTKVARLPHN